MDAILEKFGGKANSVKLHRHVNPKTMIVRQAHFHNISAPNKNIIIPLLLSFTHQIRFVELTAKFLCL